MAIASDINQSAGGLNTIASSLSALGIDSQAILMAGAAVQAVGGVGSVLTGLMSAIEAWNAVKAAEGVANIAKWAPTVIGAVAVAGIAVGAGFGMAMLIDNVSSEQDLQVDAGTSEGRRELARLVG
jgi:NAD(P)H-hydrate repair Nnr-like enzyme with NAD(P)H-hydrate dehydratase domain